MFKFNLAPLHHVIIKKKPELISQKKQERKKNVYTLVMPSLVERQHERDWTTVEIHERDWTTVEIHKRDWTTSEYTTRIYLSQAPLLYQSREKMRIKNANKTVTKDKTPLADGSSR